MSDHAQQHASIDIVFDGPPGHESGRFVEVEDTETRASVSVGEWVHRDDGYWVLRIVTDGAERLVELEAGVREIARVADLLDPSVEAIYDIACELLDTPEDQELAVTTQCPTPEYHETHRYCPSCDWHEETLRERMERHGPLVYTRNLGADEPVFHRVLEGVSGPFSVCNASETRHFWSPLHVKHASRIGVACDVCFPKGAS